MFYGWWVVVACAFALFLGPIPIMIFSFGVFLRPLVQEFHTGRGAISFAFTLQTTIPAFVLPFAGRLIDRVGAKRVIVLSTVLAAFILMSAYFCSGKIWHLYLFYVALGITAAGLAPVSYAHAIAHWFDRFRGLALSCTMAGLGIGAVIMPSVAQQLIARVGWRLTFVTVGVAVLTAAVPVLSIFLKDRPEPMGLLPDGGMHASREPLNGEVDPGLTWREATRDPVFWLVSCAFILVSASVQGCLTHLAAVLADRGTPAQAAALATSLFGGGLLLGRAGSGYFLDRFFAPQVAAIIFASAALGLGLLCIAGSQQVAFMAAFLVGIGLGAEVDIMAYLISRYFGLRWFGTIYGTIFAGFTVAGGVGAYLMGAAFDASGSYSLALGLFCVAALIGAVLLLRLGPYRFQARTVIQTGVEQAMLPSEL